MPSWSSPTTKSAPPAADPTLGAAWGSLSRRQKKWLWVWWACLVVPSMIALVVFGAQQRQNYLASAQRHADRMNPLKNDAVSTQLDLTPPAGHEHDVPTSVNVGVYVTRIPEFSIVHSTWNVDFFAWFAWTGADAALDPGETFQIVGGQILSRVPLRKTTTGDQRYALYRVTAQITKEFDVARFPRDEHLLTITLEDQGLEAYRMVYVADTDSEISSRVFVAGYTIGKIAVIAKPHTYKTAMGDPSLLKHKATYSDFVFGVPLVRTTWGLFFKMFTATYLAIVVALAGLLAHGTGERIGLASTALFVQVVNALTIETLIPDTGVATLADVVNGLGYFVIGLLLLQGILYHRFLAEREGVTNVTLVFDRSTFVLAAMLTVIMNTGILWQATPH
jgi:hypothetical protein